MTDWNAVSAFMANVVPWPGSPTDPGHVGLWYSGPNTTFDPTKKIDFKNKPEYISGWPYRAVDQFVSRVGWVNSVPDKFKNQWFCTSLQRRDGKTKHGKPKAQKSAVDALASKSIFIDIDIEANNPKKYPTKEEAWQEFCAARKKLNLPKPSAVIDSGGGFHIYWINKTAMLPHEWQPYAQGLKNLLLANNFKFDPTVTADIARIMRVPGSINYKYDPPRPVELLTKVTFCDFTQLDFLKTHAGVAPAKTAQATQLFAEGANMDSFKAAPPWKFDGEPGLDGGIDKFGDSLLDPLPIFEQCGFYQEALRHGGKNNDQPQWNLAVLGTTFMEDGNDIAHSISKAYATYSEVDTQALYDRKLAERTDRGIGYPSCNAIAGTGCEACKTCPLFQKGKSPLNIRPEPNQGGGAAQQTPNAGKKSADSEDEWPDGYSRGGAPAKGYANTLVAFHKLGIKFTLDTFRQKEFSEGHEIELLNGELSDRTVTMLRDQISRECGFYPEKETAREAITAECYRNRINPVTNYFDGLKWDGVERLPKLLHEYLGAEDTPLNAAISVKLMGAIVRRSKRPGCKYDQKVVLQGGQGVRKSMFCEDLAVFPDLFTDAGDLSGSIKEQMEITQGKQIIEFAELAGFNQNSRERNKGNLSRRVDRARLAYAHYAKDEPRSSVPIGTTNPGGYLKDPTGERRYWHVAVNKYDRDKFMADKDQLYAEAVVREPKEKLWLDTPELVKAHDAIVATAKEPNALVDDLTDLAGEVWEIGRDKMAGGWLIHREERVSNKEVRCKLGIFGIEALRMRDIGTRISDAMMTLGWTKATGTLVCKHGGDPEGGYRRQMPDGYELDAEPTAQGMDAA